MVDKDGARTVIHPMNILVLFCFSFSLSSFRLSTGNKCFLFALVNIDVCNQDFSLFFLLV